MRKHRVLWPAGLVLGLALGGGAALAAEPAASVEAAMATLHWTQPAQSPAADPAPVLDAEPAAPAQAASDATLEALAGRGTDNVQVALTEQSLSAVNTGNTINANTVGSGAISLQDSALSGFSGIGNIMMNTGHNNNLESNMSVTIVITP